MLKNIYTFLIFLLFAHFISKTATDTVASSKHTEREKHFTKVIKTVKNDIYYKVLRVVTTLTTLPAAISNNVTEFINKFTDVAEEMEYLTEHAQFYLYTPANPYKKWVLELNHESFHKSMFNPSLETKFIIHGFREHLSKNSIIYDIKDQLFQKGNYNIIIVDWIIYSQSSYNTAASNSIFIGYEIATLIKLLIIYKGISPKSIHLIAHSVGCHAAGNAGKMIPNLGRITGLDATGLIFDDIPSSLKITNTDAEFVDAIHTHGPSSETEGLGTLIPYGDIDFFPNGGSVQPGCNFGNVYIDVKNRVKLVNTPLDFIFCNHQRALFLFLESINGCWFESVMCSSYSDFKKGKCPRETSVLSRMGFHATKIASLPEDTNFYLETNDKYPFCFENL